MTTAVETSSKSATVAAPLLVATPRNQALDVYRGFVMFLMLAEVLRLSRLANTFPGNPILQFLSFNQTHVEWAGCSLHDLIQPSFSFLVGAALPYSIASRLAKGKKFSDMFAHAIWRAVLLAWLGIFLRSTHSPITRFTFEDTLTQIGLGYPVLFLLGFRSPRWQWTTLGILLFGYWLSWALWPLPPANFDWQSVGVPPGWSHFYTGFAAHWNKNANLGTAFDQWFLNLFPREKPFVFNGGGYLTLSFIPTLGTMILGLIAGRWLKDGKGIERKLLVAGVVGIATGVLLHFSGVCPVVKRIWTPSWTISSGGACFLLLLAFHWILDVKGWRGWAFPLKVIGANSIAAYVMAHVCEEFFQSSLKIHLGWLLATTGQIEFLVRGIAVLAIYWLILLWMFRRNILIRI